VKEGALLMKIKNKENRLEKPRKRKRSVKSLGLQKPN
jgi:hypothetical protein